MQNENDEGTGIEMVNISIPREHVPLMCNALEIFAAIVRASINLGPVDLEAVEKMAIEYHNGILTMAPERFDGRPI